MTTTIKLASSKDLQLILPLMAAYHLFEQLGTSRSQRESAVSMLLKNPALGGIWLIYFDNMLAGYIVLCRGYSIEFGGFDAHIDEFFLSPEFRGQGIGMQTLEQITVQAKALEIKALHLEVAENNNSAQKLYRNAGFKSRDKYRIMSADLRE